MQGDTNPLRAHGGDEGPQYLVITIADVKSPKITNHSLLRKWSRLISSELLGI